MNPKTKVQIKTWQIKDWCFHNFELYMIDKVRPRPGGITLVQGLTNGFYRKEAEDFRKIYF
jgi:hypothetical protein